MAIKKSKSAAATKTNVAYDDPYEYLHALGGFVLDFATVESHLFYALAKYAGIKQKNARAVFAGVRTEVALDSISRLFEVSAPGRARRDDMAYISDMGFT